MKVPKINQKKLRDDLQEVFARHGFEVLSDDGLTTFRDANSDAYMVYFRPAGWKDAWKYHGPEQTQEPPNKKADPKKEPACQYGCCDTEKCHRCGWM